jgi:undecaprenyl-diphosphatase
MTQPDQPNLLQRSFTTLAHAWRRTFRPERTALRQNLLPDEISFWLCVAVILVDTILLMMFWDVDVTYWKRANVASDSLIADLFQMITQLGTSGWVLITTAVIGLTLSVSHWNRLPRETLLERVNWYADANFAFFTIALSGIAASLIKNTIGRARPKMLDTNGAFHFEFAAFEATYASFPSGHSTTSGAIGMVLILLFPRYWPLWLVIAVLGGVSRVMVGAHYPSDVLAGLAFGAGFVIFSARWLALRGTMFTFGEGWIPQRRR